MSIISKLKEGSILPIYKPLEWTSFDVVRKIKTLCREAIPKLKIGHAGTLDPLAEGLLIICTEKMTKQVDNIHALPKTYIATIVLGANRPSYDKETEISETFTTEHLTLDLITEALKSFEGKQTQFPPAHSAVKLDGKRAFLKARQGIEVITRSRDVEFYSVELLSVELTTIKVKVKVSKGTYIRTLAFDLGVKLNSGAYLDHLVRTDIGDYSIDNSISIVDLENEIKLLFPHTNSA
jgi:tRNA pseudouridine55 synthase